MSKNCCTYWLEGWWETYCCKHDEDYSQSGKTRIKSDNDLFVGVLTSLREKEPVRFSSFIITFPIASIMFIGVRVGGRKRYVRKQNIMKIKKFRAKHD